jgi:hypothetical protein
VPAQGQYYQAELFTSDAYLKVVLVSYPENIRGFSNVFERIDDDIAVH